MGSEGLELGLDRSDPVSLPISRRQGPDKQPLSLKLPARTFSAPERPIVDPENWTGQDERKKMSVKRFFRNAYHFPYKFRIFGFHLKISAKAAELGK